MIPLVIPLHPSGGKLKNDTELRFALRSIDRFFTDPVEVILACHALPSWVCNVTHLPVKGGLKTALVSAAKTYPDGFFWFYDDCCLLRPTNATQMRISTTMKSFSNGDTKWGRKLNTIRTRLAAEGYEAKDYSRPHCPYWFDKSMVDEAFQDWPKMAGKFPFESWILSKRNWPSVHGGYKQYYGAFKAPPGDHCRYLNYNDKGNTPELRDWLLENFPEPCRYENTTDSTLMNPYEMQSPYLLGVWKDEGSPRMRTICECAVGPFSLLEPYKDHCGRAIFIEPDPAMASKARVKYPWAVLHQVAVTDKVGTANLRKLRGSSYVKGIGWAPIFDSDRARAEQAGKVAISTVTFDMIDDGEVDMLNLDCEGSEWFVLKNMVSRPRFLQVELHKGNPHRQTMLDWIAANGYTLRKTWGIANHIYVRP